MTLEYRIWAQDALTREFLESEVPLIDVEVTDTLNGTGEISGTFNPEIPRVQLPTFQVWRTLLHVEYGGEIRNTGIITPYSLDDVALQVAAPGFTEYPHGISYRGVDIREVNYDPLNVVRRLWTHLQNYPNGDLGVNVDQSASTVKIGSVSESGAQDAAQTILDHLNSGGTLFEDFTYPNAPQNVSDAQDVLSESFYSDNNDFTRSAATTFLQEVVNGNTTISTDGPYELFWWDAPDIGQEIDSLADETGFEYHERSYWNTDKTDVILRLALGYPRLGRRRDDLRFNEYENIIQPVPITEQGDRFATGVLVLGAGEGRDRVFGEALDENNEQLRRVVTIEDDSITSKRRARQRARNELASRRSIAAFEEIEVDLTHPNAKLGTFGVGDDIPVTGDFPWVGTYTIYHRITQMTLPLDTQRARLSLAPSDTFRYGS